MWIFHAHFNLFFSTLFYLPLPGVSSIQLIFRLMSISYYYVVCCNCKLAALFSPLFPMIESLIIHQLLSWLLISEKYFIVRRSIDSWQRYPGGGWIKNQIFVLNEHNFLFNIINFSYINLYLIIEQNENVLVFSFFSKRYGFFFNFFQKMVKIRMRQTRILIQLSRTFAQSSAVWLILLHMSMLWFTKIWFRNETNSE